MSEIHFLSLIIGLLVGLIIGFIVFRMLANKSEPKKEDDPLLEEQKSQIRDLNQRLEIELSENKKRIDQVAALNEKIRSTERELELKDHHFKEKNEELQKHFEERLNTQKEILNETKKRFSDEFKVLADRIFEDKSEKFTKQNKENLESFLNPLKEKLKSFEEKVEKTYDKGKTERLTLKTEIEQLVRLNQQLSQDANNLASALKGESKTQGDWGEFQLELILEKAGLVKDIHFSTQSSYRDDEGGLKRPDMIINLPEGKNLIVDSKVSLVAYEGYMNEEDDVSKSQFLKRHIESVRTHIKGLHEKKYQELYEIQSPDYVLMFVPLEPALTLAVQADQKLFTDSLEKNVVLVSNSTLLATMKTVSFIWKQEDQKKNVLEIARQGASLYDKFVGFTEDLLKIGRHLNATKDMYDGAMNKLSTGRDNLIRKTEKLRSLGLKTQKQLNDKLIDRADDTEEIEQ